MAYFVGPFLTSINLMTAFAHRSPAEGPGGLHAVSAAFNLLDRVRAASRLHSAAAEKDFWWVWSLPKYLP